jgi:hypothetical protein
MKPKYQFSLILLRAGWSVREVATWLIYLRIHNDELAPMQKTFAYLHYSAVTHGYNSLLDLWGRLWAMTNCARRA